MHFSRREQLSSKCMIFPPATKKQCVYPRSTNHSASTSLYFVFMRTSPLRIELRRGPHPSSVPIFRSFSRLQNPFHLQESERSSSDHVFYLIQNDSTDRQEILHADAHRVLAPIGSSYPDEPPVTALAERHCSECHWHVQTQAHTEYPVPRQYHARS